GRATEHREPAIVPVTVERAIGGCPAAVAGRPDAIATIDGGIVLAVRRRTIPERQTQSGAADEVHLSGEAGLYQQDGRFDATGQSAERQTVVGEIATVVDQPVHARAEAADVGDPQIAV